MRRSPRRWASWVNPKPYNLKLPSTLNPQPQSLNPQPSTLNTQPQSLNPQPSTLNPNPQTLNHARSQVDMNNYFTEMCSGSEAGSYFRLKDFVYHSNLGLSVVKRKIPE